MLRNSIKLNSKGVCTIANGVSSKSRLHLLLGGVSLIAIKISIISYSLINRLTSQGIASRAGTDSVITARLFAKVFKHDIRGKRTLSSRIFIAIVPALFLSLYI